MNPNVIVKMLQCNKPEAVLDILLLQPPSVIVVTLRDMVELHNSQMTKATEAFLEVVEAAKPRVQTLTRGTTLSNPKKFVFSK